MAIVVEDGTVVTGANSYVTEAALTTYATARGVTLTGDTEELLIRAMDYLENLEFIGIKYSESQALQWPRTGVIIDGYYKDYDEIPTLLQEGLMEIAMSIDNSEDPLANIERVKTRTTIGPISVEYAPGQSTTIVRKINNKLRKLLSSSGNGSSFVVNRG